MPESRPLWRGRCIRTLIAVLVAIGPATLGQAAEVYVPTGFVTAELRHDVSPPLRTLAATPEAGQPVRPRVMPLHRLPLPSGKLERDGALQSKALIPLGASVIMNFPGLGVNSSGFKPLFTPPDTSGAAGATQYVQWVNTSFAVFDKSTGAMLLGPLAGNALWFGFGGGCEYRNDGDPIVEYDKSAGRWVLSQFTAAPPYLECVAVSTSSDATGSYYRYAFSMGANFADYPHMGVWPDGYYFSFNMFNGGTLIGGRACAFDRNAMLSGSTATQECFDSAGLFGAVPSDWDGALAPPTGSPNYFVTFGNNLLNIWSLHADFTNPANAQLTGPIVLPVESFTPACKEVEPGPIKKGKSDPENSPGCVPQAGVPMKLDEISDRMMYRAAYRNFGDHEALVATHTVARAIEKNKAIGAALRWYEVRGLSTAPYVYQQGTYAPDVRWRWMGSIGMDSAGDIGIGYSLSGPGIHPHIAYTGRTPGDPAGTMESEGIIVAGKGSQRDIERWGDYSALSIDPTDDCTFWYTTEYIPKTGLAPNWQTQIASFKFRNCVPPAPAY